ncbi:hypothetical protein VTJ04DRAFT_7716 [Mycothermus thermophilus]|uniref:uncharacterized protein n=1 Tax=Humicola insolens TaxID=85995 RepID=UPI0037442C66
MSNNNTKKRKTIHPLLPISLAKAAPPSAPLPSIRTPPNDDYDYDDRQTRKRVVVKNRPSSLLCPSSPQSQPVIPHSKASTIILQSSALPQPITSSIHPS